MKAGTSNRASWDQFGVNFVIGILEFWNPHHLIIFLFDVTVKNNLLRQFIFYQE